MVAQLDPLIAVELEHFAVRPIGRRVCVLGIVRLVVVFLGVKRAIVALLKLYRMRACSFRRIEQVLTLLDVAFMVLANLGDDIHVVIVADLDSVHDHFTISHDYTLILSRETVVPAC